MRAFMPITVIVNGGEVLYAELLIYEGHGGPWPTGPQLPHQSSYPVSSLSILRPSICS